MAALDMAERGSLTTCPGAGAASSAVQKPGRRSAKRLPRLAVLQPGPAMC
jgi:hypothetical protein